MSELIRYLPYDFNSPPNKGGFYEVVLDHDAEPPKPGDEVSLGDSELRRRGRIRCLMAVVEPTSDFEDVD